MISLLLTCADCGVQIPLQLADFPKTLLLTCPACRAGLFYAGGKTRALPSRKIAQWKEKGRPKNFGDLLKLLNADPRKPGGEKPAARKKSAGGGGVRPRRASPSGAGAAITGDDVLNLVIDLHTSSTVDEFLNKLI